MFFPAAIRSVLALAALAAIGIPTFLPALHLLPGMSHGDCACGEHRSAGDPVYERAARVASQSDACGGCEHGSCVAPADDLAAESVARSGWVERRIDADSDCLLCALFASFVLSQPEQGYVPPTIDVVTVQELSAPAPVQIALRSAACRGPPAAV